MAAPRFMLAALLAALAALAACGPAVRSGTVETPDGAELYYEECGEGTPVVLLHGHSLDARMWDEQFSAFAQAGHRVVRFDFRGYGRSSGQSETQQFTHAGDAVAVMDALGIGRAHLVGLSMGGFVGADMLGAYPERLLSATLASGNIRRSPGPSTPMDSLESARRDAEIAALRARGVDSMKREWFEGLMRSAGSQRERMREPLWRMIEEWSAWQPLHKEVRVIIGLDAWARIKELRPDVPVLLVEGRSEHNRFNPSPEILQYLPRGRMVVIDDCGHMLSMERPGEFNSEVLDFIGAVDAQSAESAAGR